MMYKTLLIGACSLCFLPLCAQVNDQGKIQVGLGSGLGFHTTHFNSEVSYGNYAYKRSDDDGAVTVTFPLNIQYGVSKKFSVGIQVEPGRYLDSAGTNPNGLFLLALSPRFYAVNRDRLAFFVHLDLGLNYLKLAHIANGRQEYEDRYSGGYLRPGLGLQWFFTDVVGLHFGLDYTGNTFNWLSRKPEDPTLVNFNYKATLRTSGVLFLLGLQAKF